MAGSRSKVEFSVATSSRDLAGGCSVEVEGAVGGVRPYLELSTISRVVFACSTILVQEGTV
jgi:hypothetical protein